MSAPTPGPWAIATSNSWRRIVSARGVTVCEPITQPDGHPDLHFPNGGADGSDAHVLAASWDMHEALKSMRAYLSKCPPHSEDRTGAEWGRMMDLSGAALAKAEGKS